MTDAAVAVAERPGTALTIAPEQTSFDQVQLAALRSIGLENAPDDEIALFFHLAKRSGLDPFARQIYLIARKSRALVQGEWVDVDKWTVQTSIDGFRIYRDRAGGFAGQREQWAGQDGVWRDVWLSREFPSAARVLVWREGWTEPVQGIALWHEFAPYKNDKPQAMWGKMPSLMLSKCAEALALRKAFPQDLSGLYVTEEMDQADPEVQTLRATVASGSAAGDSRGPATTQASSGSAPQGSASPSSAGPGQAPPRSQPSMAEPSKVDPDPELVARVRQAVLSVEWQGAQGVDDDGMRTMFRRVKAAGLLDYPIAPGHPTFRETIRDLGAKLPKEKPAPPAEQPPAAQPVPDPQPPTSWASGGWDQAQDAEVVQ